METMKPELESQHQRRRMFVLQSRICKAMAHPVRLEIVDLLSAGEATAAQLLQSIEISKATLSKHMALLVTAGIVAEARERRQVRYRLTCPEIHSACELMRATLLRQLRAAGGLASELEQQFGAVR
jgi:DNA-binding transcriptional ArsR family regulator